ncbi:hypothetical protein ACB098_04G056000 [Castanea mollissima]
MRRLFLELYHKQIFPFTPITSFSSFLSYIVVTPLMLGIEKDFSCHSHLGHRVIQISCVFRGFPMLQLSYQFGRSGMDRLNIPLGSLVLTLLCGIHSRSALGITSGSGWNSSQNPTTSPTSLPPTVSCTSIETEWFHVPLLIGYSSLFVSLFPILVSISLQD